MDDTWYKYQSDIKKLKEINDKKWVKLFCSFKYVFIEKEKEIDQAFDFHKTLENEFGTNATLIQKESFKTKVKSL